MPLYVPKDRKSLFRQFLAGMYDAVVITDPSGHIIEINPRAAEFFGWSTEEVIDKPISFFVRGLSDEVVWRIRNGLSQDRHVMIDANGTARDGTRFACEITIASIELSDPDDLVFTIRNVERRRKVNDMLRSKENAFEIAPTALFACDPEGRITQANAAFLALFGLADIGEARGHDFSDFMSDDPLPENFRKALAGETTTVGLVAESDDEAEDDGELEVTLAPDRQGRKIRGVVGSILQV